MPSKKKKYNARFPAGRIKRIMQSDEEVGKVAQAVPIIISRTLELFVESLLTKTLKITNSRNAKTLSTSHMKQCIMSEQRFDFLRELVRNIPDISVAEEAANYNEEDNRSSPEEHYPDSDTPYDLSMPSSSLRAIRQQQQKQSASNGHNNDGQHHNYQRNNLKRSTISNTSSITKNTTAVSQTMVDILPPKLARSDSVPVPQNLSSTSSITATTVQQHPRLKHQSYSMPTTPIDSKNKPNTNSPPKQLRTLSQQTAIPAPIVSIDYCNKPVVKIDYSNLPITEISTMGTNTAETPLSAPASIASTSSNSTFNFSAAPVINIDLSNIVTASTEVTTASAVPNVATISIGTPSLQSPQPTISSPTKSLLTSPSPSTNSKATNEGSDQQSGNSKAVKAEPLNSSPTLLTAKANALAAAAVNMTTTTSTTKSDSYLEMDEDYDNI